MLKDVVSCAAVVAGLGIAGAVQEYRAQPGPADGEDPAAGRERLVR